MINLPEVPNRNAAINRSLRRQGASNDCIELEKLMFGAASSYNNAEELSVDFHKGFEPGRIAANLVSNPGAGIKMLDSIILLSVVKSETDLLSMQVCESHAEWYRKAKFRDLGLIQLGQSDHNLMSLTELGFLLQKDSKELDPYEVDGISNIFNGTGKNGGQSFESRRLVDIANLALLENVSGYPSTHLTRPLLTNLGSYYDFFTPFLNIEGRAVERNPLFVAYLRSQDERFGAYLAMYHQVKFGLSTSQIERLFSELGDVNFIARLFVSSTHDAIFNWIGDSFEENELEDWSEDVVPYLKFDKKNDAKASRQVSAYYKGKGNVRDVPTLEQMSHVAKKLIKSSSKAAINTGSRVQSHDIAHPLFKEAITLSKNKNKKGKDMLTVILICSDDSYLNLQINGTNGQISGIPLEIVKNVPRIKERIFTDVLYKLAGFSDDGKEIVKFSRQINIDSIHTLKIMSETQMDEPDVEKVITPRIRIKTKKSRSPEVIIPEYDDNSFSNKRVLTVFHTPDEIATFIPGLQKKYIDQILGTIEKFEFGHGNVARIESSKQGDIRLRSGDYRIILRPLGGTSYEIVEISARGNVSYNRKNFN